MVFRQKVICLCFYFLSSKTCFIIFLSFLCNVVYGILRLCRLYSIVIIWIKESIEIHYPQKLELSLHRRQKFDTIQLRIKIRVYDEIETCLVGILIA